MRAHRPFWRALVAILQVAALLALTIAVPAHARTHAQGAVAGHGHMHLDADHAGIDGLSGHASKTAADASGPTGDTHSGQCCGVHCPFHIPFVGGADVTVPLRWNAEPAFRRPRDAAFVSVVPEALPEPPRSFA